MPENLEGAPDRIFSSYTSDTCILLFVLVLGNKVPVILLKFPAKLPIN